MILFVLILIFIAELAFPSIFIFIFVSALISALHGAPYVPMGKHKVEDILKNSDLRSGDVFYDLGSGDGRILLAALDRYQVRKAVGYEVSPWPYLKSLWNMHLSHAQHVEIHRRNFFESNLSEATFVYAYLFPKLMHRLAKKLAVELQPGSRVFCPAFPIDLKEFPEFELIKEGKAAKLSTYLYRRI